MHSDILKQFASYGLESHNPINGSGFWSEEQILFLDLLEKSYNSIGRPDYFRTCELGTHNGSSLLLTIEWFRQKQKENPNFSGAIYSIDIKYPPFFYLNMKRANVNIFDTWENHTDEGLFVRCFEGSSLDIDLGNMTKLDFLLIDAYHSYSTVLAELNKFNPIMDKNSYILSHDHSPKINNKDQRDIISKFEVENRDWLEKNTEEDFFVDEALIRFVNENPEYEFVNTQIDCFYPERTGLSSWVRKKTSPSSAIACIRKL